jgi:hypothetical protein
VKNLHKLPDVEWQDSSEAGIRVGGQEGHVRLGVGEVVFRDDVRETRGQERCRAECTKMDCMTSTRDNSRVRTADVLNGYGNMCHWNVVVTTAHLRTNKVRLCVSLGAERIRVR